MATSRTRNRLIAGIGAIALAATASGAPTPFGARVAEAAPPVQLTFLNINDFHGRIDPAITVQFAGRIASLEAAAPGGAANTAILSAGDNIGASLFASSVAKDQPTIDVLNAIGLDASAVGNHEFDKGFADLQGRVIGGNGPNTPAAWTYLGANVYTAGTTTPALPEYKILTLGGITVAVIGAVTSETPQLVSPSGVSGLTFGDPVDAVNRVADDLTDGVGQQAQVIVAEYHEGAPDGAPATLQQELVQSSVFNKIVTVTSPKVDAIFTGHTHRQYAYDAPIPGNTSHTRPVLQSGSYGDFVGHVVLEYNPDTDGVTTVLNVDETRATTPATSDTTYTTTYSNVATVKTIVDNALAHAAEVGGVPVGSVAKDITRAFSNGTNASGTYVGGTTEDRGKESTIGNLVANALVPTLSAPERGGATIGVVNPGGLRADLARAPDSVVTVAEATSVLPFANSLNTISLTGAQFKTLLEQQWQRLPDGTVPSRPYLQLGLSDNVSYTYDSTLSEGSRITSITIDGKPIDPAASYRIGTFSFLTDGGDNFRIFTQGTNKKDSGLIDADGWIQYITAGSPLSPNFARHSVEVSPLPTAAIVGSKLNFNVSSLDMTSLGAPANTSVKVTVGGVDAGSVPVVGGKATVNVTVPSAAPGGAQNLVLTAVPSGTKVTIPVTVARTLAPVSPTRLFDTREGQSPNSVITVPKAKIGGDKILEVKVIDIPGLVPATGVGAVSLNVTATNAEGNGYLTVYACGTRKEVSSLNYTMAQDSANAVTVPVSATGTVCFYSQQLADVVVDVNGWFATGSGFSAVGPERVFDTRAGESTGAIVNVPKAKVGGANVLEVKVTGLTGLVPASGVTAVSLNVTAVNGTQDGFVTVYPCGERKTVSSLNYTNGRTTANGVVTPVSSTGTVCFFSQSDIDLVVDVNGWYSASSSFTAVAPDRVFDTRTGESPAAIRVVPKAKVGDPNVLEVKVTDLPGLVPATGVGAVSLNVAAVNASAAGFLTVYPCGTRALVSSLNYVPKQTVANAVIAPVSATGTICFYSQNPIDILADVNGWFAA